MKSDSEPRARTGRRRQHREAQSVESFALPEGAEVSVVRERSPEQVAAAARWIKKHMPGVARRGQKTAQEILRDIRGK